MGDIFKTTTFLLCYCLFHIVRDSLFNLMTNMDFNTGVSESRDIQQQNNHCVFTVISMITVIIIITNRPYTNKFKYILISFLPPDTSYDSKMQISECSTKEEKQTDKTTQRKNVDCIQIKTSKIQKKALKNIRCTHARHSTHTRETPLAQPVYSHS